MHQGAFDVGTVLRLIENERVTNWGAVPTMANRLIGHAALPEYDLSSLTAFSLASAPSPPAFKERRPRERGIPGRARGRATGIRTPSARDQHGAAGLAG